MTEIPNTSPNLIQEKTQTVLGAATNVRVGQNSQILKIGGPESLRSHTRKQRPSKILAKPSYII